jgi:hypothetical protein
LRCGRQGSVNEVEVVWRRGCGDDNGFRWRFGRGHFLAVKRVEIPSV